MRAVAAAAFFTALFASPLWADDVTTNPLFGTWRITSFKLQVVGESESRDIFGSDPKGVIVLTPEHRIVAMFAANGRKPANNEADSATLLQSMIAYTGKFRLEPGKLTTDVDVSWNQIYVGTPQVRLYEVDGDKLTIRTPQQPSGTMPGMQITSVLTFERER